MPPLMRRRTGRRSAAPALLPLLLLLASPTAAGPYPKDDLHDLGAGFLMPRDCVQYCGYNNMYCCGSGQACYTSDNIAGCKNTAAGGGYNLYTTTWTLTETFTSTFSSLFPAATATGAGNAACVPEEGTGQIACGNICCASWQYCAFQGQCSANPGAAVPTTTAAATVTAAAPTTPTATPTYYTTYTTTGGEIVTTPYSPPVKVIPSGSSTATGTALGATGTAGVITGTTASSKLSGGAIAGIVIGTLAGVVLLILICACVLVRGLWHAILAIFGLGPSRRRREEEVVVEERYHRHGSAHGSAWHGHGPPPPPMNEKHHTGRRWLGIGAAVGTVLLLLGLRRHDKNKQQQRPLRTRSDVSSGYYTGTGSYMSGSRDSRRTRDTRHTRRTDATRISAASRPSRRPRGSRSSRS